MLFIMALTLIPGAMVRAQGELIVVTIQGDAAAMKDTMLNQDGPTTNYGTNTFISAGEDNTVSSTNFNSLLEFDLSGLPQNMTVVSATLSLWVSMDRSDNARSMSAYPLKRQWTETGATWNQYIAGYNWTTAGGTGSGDIDSGAIGTVSLANNLAVDTQVDMTLSPSAVEAMAKLDWFGFELQMATGLNDRYAFYSSDYSTATLRPKLVIEYYPGTPHPDPGWKCFQGQYGGEFMYIWPQCQNTETISPYFAGGQASTSSPVGSFIVNETAATLQCTPYPQCVNNYDIYYRIAYTASWNKTGPSLTSTLHNSLIVLGNPVDDISLNCGSGLHGECSGIIRGVIPRSLLPVNTDGGYTLGVQSYFSWDGIVGEMTSRSIAYNVTFSLLPITDSCASTWFVPVPDTYTIDPTEDNPEGAPIDTQVYTTVIGQVYMARVQQGPWNDGSIDRTDAVVSLNGGLTWLTWDQFEIGAVCVDADPSDPNYDNVYFTATDGTFRIKVNDTPGSFGNNTNDQETPYEYVIGIAFENPTAASCESQFAYDPDADLVASTNIAGTSIGALANPTDPLTPGDWYAVKVENSATWNETGGSPRVDMEKQFYDATLNGENYSDLSGDGQYGWCTSSDGMTVFIQAPAQNINLRVNDQDDPQDFSDNQGSLNVSIYRAAFTRYSSGCELQFGVDGKQMLDQNSVAGNASNGKDFASYVLSFDDTTLWPQRVNAVQWSWNTFSFQQVPGYLMPGLWYMLETIEGPWTLGSFRNYTMQIKVGDAPWTALADWSGSECTVPVDALGHVRMYFKIPKDEALLGQPYLLRVASSNFIFTGGSMGWQLYGSIIDYGLNQNESGTCADYIFDPDLKLASGWVQADKANGQFIPGMAAGEFRAIQINSSATDSDPPVYRKSGWWESNTSATEMDGLQITSDGETWTALPNAPGVLCYYNTPSTNELVFFVRSNLNQTWKLRANSNSFADNIGTEYYTVYTAVAADTIDKSKSCLDTYTASVPALNEAESIPVQEDGGVTIQPTLSYTPGLTNNLTGNQTINDLLFPGVHAWGDAPTLEPDHDYMVSIVKGPWTGGQVTDSGYDAQLSSDGGSTWYSFADHPDVLCSTTDQTKLYDKVVFRANPGQVWKIRVSDTGGNFDDNGGGLWYSLNLVNEFPVDGPGALAVDGFDPQGMAGLCSSSLIAPTSTIVDLATIGPFFTDRLQYYYMSFISYFAWCPRHVQTLVDAIKMLQTKEPLATINELRTITAEVKKEVQSYNWDTGGMQDTSIFDMRSSADIQNVFDRILPNSGAGASPWEDGGNLVNFTGNTGLPSYYYTCLGAFATYLPSRLQSPVCFASAYWKQTGASFWVQLMLDIGAIFLMLGMIKGAAQSLVYMMTGVRPWTKDWAGRMIINIARGDIPPENSRFRR